ncbi:MAG: polyribonucleotide nucleotidyltransferase [Opitutae bacterium]|nr:polyribonucleotide nucleotidyltransferase [Opitutae bacterium]|tara:strand:+ start:3474 stop:5675 length:2202 start_codon:yes stop_codon:yes gene_type:complete
MNQKHNVTAEKLGIQISSGTLAGLAGGAVTISMGETDVFVSATASANLRPGQDFFPLTVDYREKFTAAGKFPGGYFKREGKPSEKEILTSRLCDRPLRPLFPKGFLNEVQVIGYLLSTDQINESDILMVNGASAALMISDIPWNGPVGCVRLGEIDGEFVVNPNNEQMYDSALDLIYVGSAKEMLMIEGSADQISEDRFVQALEFAHDAIQDIITAQIKLAELCGKQKKEFKLVKVPDEVLSLCKEITGDRMDEAIFAPSKQERQDAVDVIKEEATTACEEKFGDEFDPDDVKMAFEVIQEQVYRENILERGKRADGRGPDDLREITCETGVLPRVHGSAVFTRGETQSLVLSTLGTSRDVQDLDGLTGGPTAKSFILHYNFPPFSVGEAGRFGFTSRREIGHGALAERSVLPVLPPEDDFPYAIRIVSEIMSSNGSTSMASVCGGSLALMDAGVPLSQHVAGISTGLVCKMDEQGNITKHVVLTDIIGAEDHFGDMDFKVCGTRSGVTGFQLDLKIQGLPFEIAKEAVKQVTEARMKILDVMDAALPSHRKELRDHAPRIETVQIDPEKIGALIGPGGKNIRRITEVTGASIDIDEDNSGKVRIYATDSQAMERALQEIDLVTGEIEAGKIYRGIVRGVKEFGAFVECLPGKEGLCHISELADFRVNKTEDICKLGDEIIVKCIGIDDKGRVKLSRRAAMEESKQSEEASPASGNENPEDKPKEEQAEPAIS